MWKSFHLVFLFSVKKIRKKKSATQVLLKDRTQNNLDKFETKSENHGVQQEHMQGATFNWGETVEDITGWGITCNGSVL